EVLWGPAEHSDNDQRWREKHEDFTIDPDVLAEALAQARPEPEEAGPALLADYLAHLSISEIDPPEVIDDAVRRRRKETARRRKDEARRRKDEAHRRKDEAHRRKDEAHRRK